MKELDPTKKVYYINQLDEAIADYEDAMRLVILEYLELKSRRFFKWRPFLQNRANALLEQHNTMYIKYQDIKRMRFTPIDSNSN
jgi:hypothetical protein